MSQKTIQLKFPDDYVEVQDETEEAADSHTYECHFEDCYGMVSVEPLNPGSQLPHGDFRETIAAVRSCLKRGQALIEVGSGTAGNGDPFVYAISKVLNKPDATRYCLLLQIDSSDNPVQVIGLFDEAGQARLRAKYVFNWLAKKGALSPEGNTRWTFDPYSRRRKAGFLMNMSERTLYDIVFPTHPLSIARELAGFLTQSDIGKITSEEWADAWALNLSIAAENFAASQSEKNFARLAAGLWHSRHAKTPVYRAMETVLPSNETLDWSGLQEGCAIALPPGTRLVPHHFPYEGESFSLGTYVSIPNPKESRQPIPFSTQGVCLHQIFDDVLRNPLCAGLLLNPGMPDQVPLSRKFIEFVIEAKAPDKSETKIVERDITKLAVDAIVSSDSESLTSTTGVAGAIHREAGPLLANDCERIGGCKAGHAVITDGHDLPALYVIHTVGPKYQGLQDDTALLASCYRACLDLAAKRHLSTIAFPAIATGERGFVPLYAARIAWRTVHKWLKAHKDTHMTVIFCCASEEMRYIYERAENNGMHLQTPVPLDEEDFHGLVPWITNLCSDGTGECLALDLNYKRPDGIDRVQIHRYDNDGEPQYRLEYRIKDGDTARIFAATPEATTRDFVLEAFHTILVQNRRPEMDTCWAESQEDPVLEDFHRQFEE